MSKFIEWNSLDVDMPSLDYSCLENWLDTVARNHGRSIARVNYTFCNDDEILKVNRQFLGHDYFTDIITFDDSSQTRLRGDIIISLDTVRSNAEKFGQPYLRELLRVIVHGLLHLCGINDKAPGEREIMERHEDDALNMFFAVK